jgi:signal transduction histidine kinase
MTRATLQGKVQESVSRIATRAPGTGHRTARDATEREHRKLQERHEALRAELAASERRRAELFSLLAHDLKNPLSPLLICAQVLGRAIPPDHAARRSLDIVKRSADELGAAIEELSDAASIELGKLKLSVQKHLAPVDAGEMIAEALETTRRRVQDRRLEITVDDGLPLVVCDRHRVVRLLVDLVVRALRITPRGDVVGVRAERVEDDAVQLSVTDAGPAIPEEHRGTFFDLPVDATHHRATGQEFALSLYVGRGVVEAHGGWMEVDSEGERGSTVWLTLPGQQAEE